MSFKRKAKPKAKPAAGKGGKVKAAATSVGKLQIVQGDITEEATDAIVNSTDASLAMSAQTLKPS